MLNKFEKEGVGNIRGLHMIGELENLCQLWSAATVNFS